MLTEKLISTILPVFNGERLLRRAIESVVAQRLPQGWKSELIIINDASSDSTAEVIESCRKRFAQEKTETEIRVISHTVNRGAAASQIDGMRAAKGNWLARIDHDDVFPTGFLECLLDTAMSSGADIAVAPLLMVSADGKLIKRAIFTPQNHKPKGPYLNKMRLDTACFSLCNKLIRRELTVKTQLPENLDGLNCWDDVYILTDILLSNPDIRISTQSIAPYIYTVNKASTSLTHSDRRIIMADRIRCTEEILKVAERKHLTKLLSPFLCQLQLRAKANYLRGRRPRPAEWKRIFPIKAVEILAAPRIALHHRIAMALIQMLMPDHR
ncbi:MAG: glycosyltransferase [Paramuribaculum sp.]|nr:glycosyltransferase [Paramuribaculum sp.]